MYYQMHKTKFLDFYRTVKSELRNVLLGWFISSDRALAKSD